MISSKNKFYIKKTEMSFLKLVDVRWDGMLDAHDYNFNQFFCFYVPFWRLL